MKKQILFYAIIAFSILLVSVSYSWEQYNNIKMPNAEYLQEKKLIALKTKFERDNICYKHKNSIKEYYEGTYTELVGNFWYSSKVNTCVFETFSSGDNWYNNSIKEVFTLNNVDGYSRNGDVEISYTLEEWENVKKIYK